MKKQFVLVIITFFTIQSLSAQWGLEGGVDLAEIHLNNSGPISNRTGFHVGVTYDLDLGQNLYLGTGLFFYQGGGNIIDRQTYRKTITNYYPNSNDGAITSVPDRKEDHKIGIQGVELPIRLSLKPNFIFLNDSYAIIEAGVYGKYGLAGKTKITYKEIRLKGNTFEVGYKKINIGADFGLGLGYKNYVIKCSYQLGMSQAISEQEGRYNTWKFSLGYKF